MKRNDQDLNLKIEEVEDEDVILDNIIDSELLNNLNMVFFNGTCGKYEDDNYSTFLVEAAQL